MIVTSKIRMDLDRKGLVCRVDAVQGDTNTREVAMNLYAGGAAWKVPDGAAVQIRYRKPDGTGGVYDTLPDGTQAWWVSGNTLTVALAPQMLTVTGEVKMQTALMLGEDCLATFSVSVDVAEDPSLGTVRSADYVNMRLWLVEQLSGALETAAGSGEFLPELCIGTVSTLASGRNATASVTQAGKAAKLDLGIPAGYTPVKGVDYWTEEELEQIREDLQAELAAQAQQLTPLFADTVAECEDESKVYVLPDGYIYAYLTKTTYTEPVELYDPEAAALNVRHSGTPGSVVTGNGYVMTDYIPVDMSSRDPVQLRIGEGISTTSATKPYFQKIAFYDSAKACLGTTYILSTATSGSGAKYITENGSTTVDVGYLNDGTKVTYYDSIAYVRIEVVVENSPAVGSDRAAIASIIDPNSGGAKTQTGWMSTGHAFVPADYEDRIIAAEEQTAKNAENIDILEQKVEAFAEGASAAVYPSVWEDAVAVCIEKIKALQVGRGCVTFPFFSDNHQRLGYAGALIARVMDECHIPYCFYGGDSIDSGYIADEATMIEQDKAFDDIMKPVPNGRFCRAVGNHDGFWAVSADEKHTYTREQVYELFLREESIAQNKHFGDDGTYYYVEDRASKVRFVVLNTNGGSVDDTQIAWLENTALSFAESGWAVVFISHQPISNHYHANISNAAQVREIISDSGVDVIGWFSGHIHRDRIYIGAATNTTDDSEGTAMGFTQVTVTSDHTGIAYDDATKHTVANDDQSHAIDFVTVNRGARTVSITRLGIGSDRVYTY